MQGVERPRAVRLRQGWNSGFIGRSKTAELIERSPVHLSGRAGAAEHGSEPFANLHDGAPAQRRQETQSAEVVGGVVEDVTDPAETTVLESSRLRAKAQD